MNRLRRSRRRPRKKKSCIDENLKKKKKAQPKAKRAKQANRGVHFVGNDVDEVYNHRMQQAFGSLSPQY